MLATNKISRLLKLFMVIVLLSSFAFFIFNLSITTVQAQGVPADDEEGQEVPADQVKLDNPLPTGDIPKLIGNVIRVVLGIIGSIALALFIYGGFVWMTAGGNAQRVKTGRDVLLWATIGLIVIFTSFALLNFILGAIRGTG